MLGRIMFPQFDRPNCAETASLRSCCSHFLPSSFSACLSCSWDGAMMDRTTELEVFIAFVLKPGRLHIIYHESISGRANSAYSDRLCPASKSRRHLSHSAGPYVCDSPSTGCPLLSIISEYTFSHSEHTFFHYEVHFNIHFGSSTGPGGTGVHCERRREEVSCQKVQRGSKGE